MEKISRLANELAYVTRQEIRALTARPREPHQPFHDKALLLRDELHLAKDEYRLLLYRKLYDTGYTLVVPEVYLEHYFHDFPMQQIQVVELCIRDIWESMPIEEYIDASFPSWNISWNDPIDGIPSTFFMIGVDTFCDHSDMDMEIYESKPLKIFIFQHKTTSTMKSTP